MNLGRVPSVFRVAERLTNSGVLRKSSEEKDVIVVLFPLLLFLSYSATEFQKYEFKSQVPISVINFKNFILLYFYILSCAKFLLV